MVDIEDPKGQFVSLAEVEEVEQCTARLMQSKTDTSADHDKDQTAPGADCIFNEVKNRCWRQVGIEPPVQRLRGGDSKQK